MTIKVGTFNLNNLFSRYNFKAAIDQIHSGDGALTVRYEFTDQGDFRLRKFMGKLVNAKKESDTDKIAARILDMDLDVLAVQEVENIDILKEFNRDKLGGLYNHVVLIEGNDPRLIDVGIMSKLPLGTVGSFQTITHPSEPNKRIFGRDLLEVEVLNHSRTMKLFTIYNNHLKSKFGDDGPGGPGTLAGSTLGAFILVPLSEILRGIGGLRIVFYGIFLVVFIVAVPEGIFHYIQRKYQQFERWVEVE